MTVAAIAVGTLGQYLTIAAVLFAAWLIWRGGGSTALATLETANRILEKRVHDLEEQSKRDQATIGELRARTDVTLALAPMTAEIQAHDLRAQQRAERLLTVLELIAKRIGPDGDANREH